MLLAGSFISLSNLFKEASIAADPVSPLPIIVPVLCSMLLPVIFSTFGIFTKYVFGTKRISPLDFTFGYFLIVKGTALLISAWYFTTEPIDTYDYLLGSFGSILDLTGCFFANCAVSTGAPIGPIFALCDSQWIFVTAIVAVYSGLIPHWMQLIGLVCGAFGTLVLACYEYYEDK